MKVTEFFREQLDREAERSRRALEQVPEGKYDWKPHARSMVFGYLADLVATMPSWVAMTVGRDELDLAPAGGPTQERARNETSGALVQALDKAAEAGRAALEQTTEEHL